VDNTLLPVRPNSETELKERTVEIELKEKKIYIYKEG
jgi:hypothetical protein